MGRIFEVETAEEYYEQKIAVCLRDISACELDLQQSRKCLSKCDNGGTEHLETCVGVHREELRKSRERLERLKTGLKKMNIREYGGGSEESEYRN